MTEPIINSKQLSELLGFEDISSTGLNNAKHLQEAINDYPNAVEEPAEYLTVLKREIGNELTFDSINNFLQNLNVQSDAWKMESLSNVLLMFGTDKNLTLEDLIVDLTKTYSNYI